MDVMPAVSSYSTRTFFLEIHRWRTLLTREASFCYSLPTNDRIKLTGVVITAHDESWCTRIGYWDVVIRHDGNQFHYIGVPSRCDEMSKNTTTQLVKMTYQLVKVRNYHVKATYYFVTTNHCILYR